MLLLEAHVGSRTWQFYHLQELANPTVEAPEKGYIGKYSTIHLLWMVFFFKTFFHIVNMVVMPVDLQYDNNHGSFGWQCLLQNFNTLYL